VLCGDPGIDWKQVKNGQGIVPYLKSRDQTYTQVVKSEVLAKHHRALLIMGTIYFLRHFDLMPSRKQFDIEQQLRAAGANPYLLVTGTIQLGSQAKWITASTHGQALELCRWLTIGWVTFRQYLSSLKDTDPRSLRSS
jgi:hypothetical protein